MSNEECNIGLIFHRVHTKSEVYLSVTNLKNTDNKSDAESFIKRLVSAVNGNFPGSECSDIKMPNPKESNQLPFLKNMDSCSVASITNIPTEKSDKFISQTIEKLLDGIIPSSDGKSDYTIILLATPILDIEERKLHLTELYSGLAPYAGWQTNYTFTDTTSTSSMATFGVNVGASAGVQNGINQFNTQNNQITDTEQTANADGTATTNTDTQQLTDSQMKQHSKGAHIDQSVNMEINDTVGVKVEGDVNILGIARIGGGGSYNHGWSSGFSDSFGKNISDTIGSSVANTVGHSAANTMSHTLTQTLGKALTKGISDTIGTAKNLSLGANFGSNFARSSNVTVTIGKNEGITQQFTNYNIKYALQKLEMQMKRLETSSALGFWDFGAYVISKDANMTNNVAHSYLALTQGEESYMSQSSINFWRGDMDTDNIESKSAKEICAYLSRLRHPLFGLDRKIIKEYPYFSIYPTAVTATTGLSGKELAYSLNFPRKSIAGLPVIECAEFGRNVSTFDILPKDNETIKIGKIFHMHHEEAANLELSKDSLASHTFITGSTGSGKSNTVYKILDECTENGVKFLIIEPAKGEYKNVFGDRKDVQVYGTNKQYADLLIINPFSFPSEIHILEHLDRLVEIFNVCWPMYAAMPAVLKEAVEKSYEDCGWNLTESTNKYRNDLYPTFEDITRNIRTIIDTSEYDAENKGAYKGSLITRLKSLTNGINGLIFSTDEISNEKLFDENVIIDLSRVGSSETKSLIMGLLVLKLQEYRMTKSEMNEPLKHLTVLEEAHNLLKRTNTEQSQEIGNLLGKSVEMLTNAIAEMRTYGEGFIIADQAPGLLDMAVIRNTNTKIIMRLPDLGDRDLVGKAAALNDRQIEELAKLPCGVAAVYQNEWVQSVLCKVDKYETKGKYNYQPDKSEQQDTLKDRIEMAREFCQLSNDSEKVKEMLDNAMQAKALYRFSGSLYASSMQYFESANQKPDFDKLSFIVASLLPEFTKTLKDSAMKNPSDVAIWRNDLQEHIEIALRECNMQEERNLRNNLLQCVLQNYSLMELNKRSLLNELITPKAQ